MGLVLDLLRHGTAQPAAAGGDRLRELSAEGVEALGVLAGRLAAAGWAPGRVLSSPYVRALQTAHLVARGAGVAAAVEPLAALEPEREPEAVLRALAGLGLSEGHVLLVGHQPLLGLLVGHLTGAERGMGPGTLVRVACPGAAERGAGRLLTILTPGRP